MPFYRDVQFVTGSYGTRPRATPSWPPWLHRTHANACSSVAVPQRIEEVLRKSLL